MRKVCLLALGVLVAVSCSRLAGENSNAVSGVSAETQADDSQYVREVDSAIPDSIAPLLVIGEGGGPTGDSCPTLLADYGEQTSALVAQETIPIGSVFDFCTKGIGDTSVTVRVFDPADEAVVHESEVDVFGGQVIWGQRGDELLFAAPGPYVVEVVGETDRHEVEIDVVSPATPQVIYLGQDIWSREPNPDLYGQFRVVGLAPKSRHDLLVFDYWSQGEFSEYVGSVSILSDDGGGATVVFDDSLHEGQCWAVYPMETYQVRAFEGEQEDVRLIDIPEDQRLVEQPVLCH